VEQMQEGVPGMGGEIKSLLKEAFGFFIFAE